MDLFPAKWCQRSIQEFWIGIFPRVPVSEEVVKSLGVANQMQDLLLGGWVSDDALAPWFAVKEPGMFVCLVRSD